jgi:hypothetical protein
MSIPAGVYLQVSDRELLRAWAERQARDIDTTGEPLLPRPVETSAKRLARCHPGRLFHDAAAPGQLLPRAWAMTVLQYDFLLESDGVAAIILAGPRK